MLYTVYTKLEKEFEKKKKKEKTKKSFCTQ